MPKRERTKRTPTEGQGLKELRHRPLGKILNEFLESVYSTAGVSRQLSFTFSTPPRSSRPRRCALLASSLLRDVVMGFRRRWSGAFRVSNYGPACAPRTPRTVTEGTCETGPMLPVRILRTPSLVSTGQPIGSTARKSRARTDKGAGEAAANDCQREKGETWPIVRGFGRPYR